MSPMRRSVKGIRKQIAHRKHKVARFDKFNLSKKRKFGKGQMLCRRCGSSRGVIKKYGLNYCRQCFREEAPKLGFNKYS